MSNLFDILDNCVTDDNNKYPLTSSQMGIYLECLRNPTGTMYNIPICCLIDKEDIDFNKFVSCIKISFNNHKSFKLNIDNSSGNPMMIVKKDFDVNIEHIKTNNFEVAKKEFVKPFNLEKDCLFRIAIFENNTQYMLAMDFHHIICDGSSIGTILKEISLTYCDKKIPQEEVTQLDLSIFDEKVENSQEYKDSKEYFDKIFGGCEIKSEITEDFAENIDIEDKPCAEFNLFIKDDLSPKKLKEYTSKENIKLSSFFTGAFEYAVAKFTGLSETVICTATHGRICDKMKNTTGMFVRTIPLYKKIDEKQNILEYLRDVKTKLSLTTENSTYPFLKLSSDYDISSDIMFVYQSNIFNTLVINERSYNVDMIPVESAISKLSLMVIKNKDNFQLRFQYRNDLFKEETIRSFAEMYINIMEEFICKETLCNVNLLNKSQEEYLDKLNNNKLDYNINETVLDNFKQMVKEHKNKVAVVYQDKKYTYEEVDKISDNIAKYLCSKGITTGDVVAVLIPRCEYMVIASLGILKSGAAYQPLDPSYPSERLEFMVKDSSAKLLIAEESLISLLPNYNSETLYTKDINSLPSVECTLPTVKPDDLFILIYTSGSTGTPKGVMIEHKNLQAIIKYHIKRLELDYNTCCSAYASYGFDACLNELYPALSVGATVHIIDEEIRLDLIKLNKYFESNNITHAFMTTQVARQFVTEIDNHSLKFLGTGGETLVPVEPPKNYKLVNEYGPTECAVYITAQTVDKLYHRVPIGKGNDNVKLYVVDKEMRRLPIGAVGELCASGNQVSRGYLNRPEKTAEVFGKNPYSNEVGYERIYHTGDLVRFISDGTVDYIGRNDKQVKISGFRIELSEVEKIIRKYPNIKDATVVAKDFENGGKYIDAYIVSDEEIDISKLNDFILEHKPPYMVPANTMQIDKIPLNANGKVDKRKLPEIKGNLTKKNNDNCNTRQLTLLEKMICDIIEKIVGHNEFDVTDNLISIGMTSLSVIKLSVELNKIFGIEPEVKKMMRECSVLSIEDDIQKYLLSKSSINNTSENEKQNKQYKDFYSLSQTQLGVYLDCMKKPYSTMYNIPTILTFPKDIDVNRLAECIKTIIDCHPYVLTGLALINDDVKQKYVDNSDYQVEILKLSENEFADFKNDFQKPHNLMKAPLFRISLVETENNIYLLSDFHHIIFDGASVSIFIEQLKTLYEGGIIDKEDYTYFDYIEEQISKENSDEYKNAKIFFDNMMENFESSSEITPDLKGKPEEGSLASKAVPIDMSVVEDFCSKNNITPAHLFLASTFYTVSRFTNNRDVYLSTISNGRSDIKLKNTFGMFVKTLPIHINIAEKSAIDFVNTSKNVFVDSIENEIYPYSKICAEYGYAPNIMYEYQLGVVDDLVINNKKISRDYLDMNTAKFKTAVHIEEYDNIPSVVVQYNDALYSGELMETFAQCIANVTNHIINNPKECIRNISLLNKNQKAQLESFSTTMSKEIDTELLHKLFETQVDKTPNKTALVACDRTLTWLELDKEANKIAYNLIAKGVSVGSKVLLLLERKSTFFTSLFGVLKTGGAFIPTCTDYPKERIDSIIADSDVDFVITEENLVNSYIKTININEITECENDTRPNVFVKPNDLAYLIYTSGSTGKPKGVMLSHKGICNYLTYSDANIQVKEVVDHCSVYGSITTVSFDMSLKETMVSLCNGITLVFASSDETVNPILLSKLLKKNNVDAFNSTPSRLLQFMELEDFAEAMAKCKVILSGGEKYPEKLLNILEEKTNAIIINTYGPTEITVSSNAKILNNSDTITIGKPLMNYIEHIVDCDNNLVPIGVVGELLVSGCGVALGYNNLPEQTNKAFVDFNGERTYRTGDYAKWNSNGEVSILGRTDNQVKLRGLRIELGEIEKCLNNINSVKNGVALIKKVGNTECICAYYTAEKQLDTKYIKEILRNKLTDYMVPSYFIQLDKMPLTQNGKIDTKSLPGPIENTNKIGIEPQNETEKLFCDIFADILQLDKVYANDNFFDLGGTSLTATRVIISANKNNIEIAYSDVFAYPTPKQLANLTTEDNEEQQDELADISKYDYTEINNILNNNNLDSFHNGEPQSLGDVMVTGCAGFLGIHILYELLHNHNGKVYCMLRDKNYNPAEKRLSSMFFYYFEESLKEKYSDRVTILSGDVTNKESFKQFLDYHIDTVINCAANVKHFSKGTDIEDVNLYGTLNVIEFCKEANARLIHISTMSVGGMFVGKPGLVDELKENQLYFGQYQGSKYTMSKFLAERAILSEVANGFNGKIMRVGTLAARDSDGEYQINFTTNTFMGRLKSTLLIGKYPYEAMEMPFELSPIEYVAKAILLLGETPKECTVFHPFNNHKLIMGDLYDEMNRIGLCCEPAELKDYNSALEIAEQDPEKAKILSSMIAYQNMAHGQKTYSVNKNNNYTMQVLYRMGFMWPVTSIEYMKKFIVALKGLGYFD